MKTVLLGNGLGHGEGLDEACQRAELVGMRTDKALVPIAMLAVQAIGVLGASYSSWPNPIGEQVYRPHLLRDMLPLAVIACALLLAGLIHTAHHRVKRSAPKYAEPHRD